MGRGRGRWREAEGMWREAEERGRSKEIEGGKGGWKPREGEGEERGEDVACEFALESRRRRLARIDDAARDGPLAGVLALDGHLRACARHGARALSGAVGAVEGGRASSCVLGWRYHLQQLDALAADEDRVPARDDRVGRVVGPPLTQQSAAAHARAPVRVERRARHAIEGDRLREPQACRHALDTAGALKR